MPTGRLQFITERLGLFSLVLKVENIGSTFARGSVSYIDYLVHKPG